MKIKTFWLSAMMLISLSGLAMTDQQVISYIKQQAAAGKSQQQIGKELLAKGVTPEQAQRIRSQYEDQLSAASGGATQSGAVSASTTGSRQRSKTNSMSPAVRGASSQSAGSQGMSPDAASVTVDVFDEINATAANQETTGEETIFGHNIFNTNTFEPNVNLATPQNYRLGPGDEVIIDIWGANEEHLRQQISPEGSIMIEQLGPIYLNGMTIKDARNHIKSAFSKKYAGMNDEETDFQLTLGETRSIQVNIMGEVETPGTYMMSPFSSVFNALYMAGGINDIGSLRNIQVIRNGKKVAGVDIYEYLFEGKSDGNISLQEGDVIIVPPYEELVTLNGNVKRPLAYEMKPGETILDLINYSGGFTGDAYSEMVRLSRQSGTENELFNIDKDEFAGYVLKDGDIVSVGTILDRYLNRVELKGAAMRPGMYAIGQNLRTITDLLNQADGLAENAYLDRALLYREGPDLQLEIIALDLGEILAGRAADIELKKNDILEIATIDILAKQGVLTIQGQVMMPGQYPYAKNTTVEDLIFQAGGLMQGASTVNVDISRRVIDPTATTSTQIISKLYTVSITGGLGVGSGESFILEPYDVVNVRKSPGYEVQEFVGVNGQVLFDGEYALSKRNERISEIIERAGGLLDGAYIKGAYLTRRLSQDEYLARQEALRLAMSNSAAGVGDSIALSKIQVSDTYNVGIDLQKAIDNPMSTYDLVLEPGDQLYVPQLQSTVKIAGDVMFPNTVVYEPGKKLSYYIDQAGGYGQRAKKGKAFIVYMNGTVAKAKRNTVIEPGCQIIVPSKSSSSGTDWTKVLAFATSFSSVATMAATIYNIFK